VKLVAEERLRFACLSTSQSVVCACAESRRESGEWKRAMTKVVIPAKCAVRHEMYEAVRSIRTMAEPTKDACATAMIVSATGIGLSGALLLLCVPL
jgi:hypothetical protein